MSQVVENNNLDWDHWISVSMHVKVTSSTAPFLSFFHISFFFFLAYYFHLFLALNKKKGGNFLEVEGRYSNYQKWP
jgi:hypothetical protein